MMQPVKRSVGAGLDSSLVIAALRRAVPGSVCWAAVAALVRRVGDLRRRIATARDVWRARDRDVSSAIGRVAAGSRTIAAVAMLIGAPARALDGARAARLVAPFLELDRRTKVSTVGTILVVAVMTHMVATALARVGVHTLGWSVRAGVVGVGLLLVAKPDAVLAAWAEKAARPTRHA
jgi:hypothetical protein